MLAGLDPRGLRSNVRAAAGHRLWPTLAAPGRPSIRRRDKTAFELRYYRRSHGSSPQAGDLTPPPRIHAPAAEPSNRRDTGK